MNISLKDIRSHLKKRLILYKSLYQDKRTPLLAKIILWIAIGYAFLPLDLIPDFIPIIGQLDDILIVPGLIYLALKFIPKEVYLEHKNKILG